MKFKSPKALAAVLLALSLVNTVSSSRPISGYSTTFSSTKSYEKNNKVPDEIKNKIKSRLSDEKIVLDSEFSDYISSIDLDGNTINIELSDGEVISSEIKLGSMGADSPNSLLSNLGIKSDVQEEEFQVLQLKDLKLNKLYIQNKANINKMLNLESSDYYSEVEVLFSSLFDGVSFLQFDNVSVSDEVKISSDSPFTLENSNILGIGSWKSGLNISECKSIWLSGIYLNENDLSKFNKNTNLQRLFLSKCDINTETVNLKSESLKSLIIDAMTTNPKIHNLNLKCPNLETLEAGSGTYLQNVDFLKELPNLKNLSFGDFSFKTAYNDMLLSFEEKEKSVGELSEDLNNKYYSTAVYTIICDLRGMEGSNIETLSITALNCISSEDLFKVVKTLPNLKEIKGQACNNAMLYSDELVTYCEQHNIKHPFNEKSKEIRTEISRIISEIITPEMTDRDKIKAITGYVINNMEYNYEAAFSDTSKEDTIKKTWGEKLYYSLFENYGVCDGYEALTHALLQEAGIECFKQNGSAHTWELIKLDGQYYQIDTTKLDGLLDVIDEGNIEEIKSDYAKQFAEEHSEGYDIQDIDDSVPFYMAEKGDPDYQESFLSPENADIKQKSIIEKIYDSIIKGVLGCALCIKPAYAVDQSNASIPILRTDKILDKMNGGWSMEDLETLKELVIPSNTRANKNFQYYQGGRGS